MNDITREEIVNYIKKFRELDKDLLTKPSRYGTITSKEQVDKYLSYWDIVIESFEKVEQIKEIINSNMYIQEDVLKYQMIVKVMKEESDG